MAALAHDIIERLLRSPLAEQAIAEREAERLERRQALVAELREIEQERAKTLPPLGKAADRALAAVEEAEAALLRARAAYGRAFSAKLAAGDRLNRRQAAAERELEELAPPEVAAFLAELGSITSSRRDDLVLRFAPERVLPPDHSVGLPNGRVVLDRHQGGELLARAIAEARREARALALSDLPPLEVAERIAELRRRVFG